MTEQDISQPSLRPLVEKGDFRRVPFTPEFASMSTEERIHVLLEAIDVRRSRLAEQLSQEFTKDSGMIKDKIEELRLVAHDLHTVLVTQRHNS